MLTLREVIEVVPESIEMDVYVPLRVKWRTNELYRRFFWSTGIGNSSLLEIGIDSFSGIIRSITLTYATEFIVSSDDVGQVHFIEGTPVFDKSIWGPVYELEHAQYYKDYAYEFTTKLSPNKLSIILHDFDSINNMVVKSGRCLFFFNDEKILYKFEVVDLSRCEYKILLDYSNYKKNG